MHLECIHCEHISHATQSSMSTSSSSFSPHTLIIPTLSSTVLSIFLFFFFLFICCCFSNCFPLLQVLLHNALGAGLFLSTCGLLPTFSLAMASPLLAVPPTLARCFQYFFAIFQYFYGHFSIFDIFDRCDIQQ